MEFGIFVAAPKWRWSQYGRYHKWCLGQCPNTHHISLNVRWGYRYGFQRGCTAQKEGKSKWPQWPAYEHIWIIPSSNLAPGFKLNMRFIEIVLHWKCIKATMSSSLAVGRLGLFQFFGHAPISFGFSKFIRRISKLPSITKLMPHFG